MDTEQGNYGHQRNRYPIGRMRKHRDIDEARHQALAWLAEAPAAAEGEYFAQAAMHKAIRAKPPRTIRRTVIQLAAFQVMMVSSIKIPWHEACKAISVPG
jgi:hypothetical protein